MELYQRTPPDTLIVLQILSEVEVFHEVKNESQWVLGGGVHSDKWNEVPVLEATTRQCFFAEPLSMDFQSTGTGHTTCICRLPCRSLSSLNMNHICTP